MLRQRLLAAVIVRAGRAVQSFGYKRWLPLGNVACIVQNLDRWGADGIVVLSTDRGHAGPDLALLEQLSNLDLSTPLSYGGGIHTADQALMAVQAGAERLVLDRVLTETPEQLLDLASAVGRQALIACIPIRKADSGVLQHWKYWNAKSENLESWLAESNWHENVSEILVVDADSEGSQQGLDLSLPRAVAHLNLPVLAFGGLSESKSVESVLKEEGVAAAVIGNSLNYQEQSIRKLKDKLGALPLRPHQIIDADNAF